MTFTFDSQIDKFYKLGWEKDRLQKGSYRLEKERTLHILNKVLPKPPGVILDIGGAAGSYAFPLADQGYEIHLIDPVSLHIEQAKEQAKASGINLASYSLGDARKLDRADRSVDAVLLLGPLYHLTEKNDRLQALQEALRILKPEGILVAAAISRYGSFMDGVYKSTILDQKYRQIIEQDISTGQHRSDDPKYFTTAFFHHPSQFREEIKESGFANVNLMAVEGPVWHEEALDKIMSDPKAWADFLIFLEKIQSDESIIGASAHILAVARK